MTSPSISKIHVTNSTRMSLNDRFTAIATKPEPKVERSRVRSRSRSQSRPQSLAPVDPAVSFANRRLLQQLARRHKIQAALKLKRRSMRTSGAGIAVKRGSIKALRVSNNGRPIKANSMTKVATMKADYIAMAARKPLRRRSGSIAVRLGASRPVGVGGAGERIAKRRLLRPGGRPEHIGDVAQLRVRSRSRSRPRISKADATAAINRMRRGRSLSRGRAAGSSEIIRNGRSRSRSRGRVAAGVRAVSIKARLGLRPGSKGGATEGNGRNRRGGRIRTTSLSRRGVAHGRVQKGELSGGRHMNVQHVADAGTRLGRLRGRSAVRSTGRSRSRARKGAVRGKMLQKPHVLDTVERRGRRGRSQTRSGRGTGASHKNGKTISSNGEQHNQSGRSRSRGGRGRGVRGGRKLGRTEAKPVANKDVLDKELDQYMATSASFNDMDYLLK